MAIEKVEEVQKLKINLNTPEDCLPEYVRNFFIDNILSRVFAYLFGWSDDLQKPVKLKALQDGSLVVAVSSSAFTKNQTFTGTVADAEEVKEFDDVAGRVDIWSGSEPLYVSRDNGNGVWQDEIEIKPNGFYSFDARTKRLKIRSTSTGTEYQIIGWS